MSLDGTTEQDAHNIYDEMLVDELKALCKERGIEGYSTLKKSELIQLLEGTN